ncbi:MAG TPA: class I SAM-dependent methyltransferase [Terriglobales bacterium]|nr:class I SAM-dependent methyltransferase [Terriglobales bacterium]
MSENLSPTPVAIPSPAPAASEATPPEPLASTYRQAAVHDAWEAVYRDNPLLDRFNNALMDRVLDILKPSPDSLFLDAGCGVGDHTLRFIQRGYRCIGVDLSPTILHRARIRAAGRKVGSANFVSAPLERLPFADACFDQVHCRGVLMHIPDWQKSLNELCRVLKSRGGLIIMENNDRSLQHRAIMVARKFLHPRSERRPTWGGDEFWSALNGSPFVVRTARVASILEVLAGNHISPLALLPSDFLDPFRVPPALRPLAVLTSLGYCAARMPWSLSNGVVIVAAKD